MKEDTKSEPSFFFGAAASNKPGKSNTSRILINNDFVVEHIGRLCGNMRSSKAQQQQ